MVGKRAVLLQELNREASSWPLSGLDVQRAGATTAKSSEMRFANPIITLIEAKWDAYGVEV